MTTRKKLSLRMSRLWLQAWFFIDLLLVDCVEVSVITTPLHMFFRGVLLLSVALRCRAALPCCAVHIYRAFAMLCCAVSCNMPKSGFLEHTQVDEPSSSCDPVSRGNNVSSIENEEHQDPNTLIERRKIVE